MTRLSYTYENKYSHRLNRGISLWKSNSCMWPLTRRDWDVLLGTEKERKHLHISHFLSFVSPQPLTRIEPSLSQTSDGKLTVWGGRLHSPKMHWPWISDPLLSVVPFLFHSILLVFQVCLGHCHFMSTSRIFGRRPPEAPQWGMRPGEESLQRESRLPLAWAHPAGTSGEQDKSRAQQTCLEKDTQ